MGKGLPRTLTNTKAARLTKLTNTAGTASNATGDVGAAFNQTTLNNIKASLTAKINEIIDAMNNK